MHRTYIYINKLFPRVNHSAKSLRITINVHHSGSSAVVETKQKNALPDGSQSNAMNDSERGIESTEMSFPRASKISMCEVGFYK